MSNDGNTEIISSLPPIELAAIDSLNIGYIVTNIDHKVLVINYSALELLTLTKDISSLEQVVDKLPKRLVLLDHVKYCSLEHKSCNFREVELGDRIVRIFLSPIFQNNELKGNLLTLEDITEKVEAEHARDQFLAFLVHELRTPLTAIHGDASLIHDQYQQLLRDNDLTQMIDDISTGSDSLLQMVSQILDMSRLEEGRVKYDLQQFDAVGVIQDTTRSLKTIADQKGLELNFKVPEQAQIQVVGDRLRTKQVLTNLIGNALKFSEKGSISVSLQQTRDKLEVFVKDTGPGIPDDSRAKLFQKYYQATNNKFQSDSTKSTGIGLYVTRLIIEGMGGQISLVESSVGQGSTFMFSLGLATPEYLKKLEKQLVEDEQGVQHAPAAEHQSVQLARQEAV